MAITRGLRPKLASKAVLRRDRLSGKDMLLYPERGLLLNETASAVVRRCDGAHTVDEIIARVVASSSGADPAAIARDVIDFLERLAARGLIEGPH